MKIKGDRILTRILSCAGEYSSSKILNGTISGNSQKIVKLTKIVGRFLTNQFFIKELPLIEKKGILKFNGNQVNGKNFGRRRYFDVKLYLLK